MVDEFKDHRSVFRLSKNEINDSLFKNEILDDEWLNSRQAAAYLKISQKTLYNLTSGGKLPFYKFGRRNRFKVNELRELLESKKRGVFYDY